MTRTLVNQLESAQWIDRAADSVQRPLGNWLGRAPSVASLLHGVWLGHSLHAALTDIPVGAWTAGLVLDGLSTGSWRDRPLRRAADTVHAVGLAASLAAAVTGFADWSRYAQSTGKRLGFVHAAGNVAVAGLFGASLVARKRGARKVGIALAGAGFGLLAVSAWLGRELTYTLGIHVRETRKDEPSRAQHPASSGISESPRPESDASHFPTL